MGASMKRLLLSFFLIILCVAPAHAQAPEDEAAICELIDKWYAEHRAAEEGHPWAFLAPGGIDRSPG